MALIEFENYPSTDTAVNANNLNHNFNELDNKIDKIVESDNNENGLYLKFENGLMICACKVTRNISNTISWNGFYIGEVTNIPFPTNFTELYACNIDIYSTKNLWKMSGNFPSLTGTNSFYTISPEGLSGNVDFYVVAIGKWK